MIFRSLPIFLDFHSSPLFHLQFVQLVAAMIFNFLQHIPRELRDKIYMYVLASPSGANTIPLFPRNFRYPRLRRNRRLYNPSNVTVVSEDNDTTHLSLLLTCKQIRRECKELIWFHNGLWISTYEKTELCRKLEHYAALEQFQQIRCVVIRLELLDWDELEWAFHSLRPLAASAKWGNIESVQLLAKTDRSTPMDGFTNLGNLRKHGECVDGRWYRAAQISGQQARCQRKFVINTGWPRFTHQGKQMWVREVLVNEKPGMCGFLEGLNGVFGGEIYVNGGLCFKDGRRIERVVEWDPREVVVEIRPESLK